MFKVNNKNTRIFFGSFLAGIYLFKAKCEHTRTIGEMFKVNNKDNKKTSMTKRCPIR